MVGIRPDGHRRRAGACCRCTCRFTRVRFKLRRGALSVYYRAQPWGAVLGCLPLYAKDRRLIGKNVYQTRCKRIRSMVMRSLPNLKGRLVGNG